MATPITHLKSNTKKYISIATPEMIEWMQNLIAIRQQELLSQTETEDSQESIKTEEISDKQEVQSKPEVNVPNIPANPFKDRKVYKEDTTHHLLVYRNKVGYSVYNTETGDVSSVNSMRELAQ